MNLECEKVSFGKIVNATELCALALDFDNHINNILQAAGPVVKT